MTNEERLNRLEGKLDRLQETSHSNHLELLECFQSDKEETMQEINVLKLKIDRHDGYFASIGKILGFGGLVSGWLALKDYFPHK